MSPLPVSAMRDRFPLRVVAYEATKKGDAERGPAAWVAPEELVIRLLTDGELAWVYGPRRHDLAHIHADPQVPRGGIALRDITGVTLADMVHVIKPDLDDGPRGHFG